MAQTEPTVVVAFGSAFVRYEITDESGTDGPMLTIQDALLRFNGGEELKEDLTVRINGLAVTDTEAALRDGDVLLIATERSAKGGFEGA